MRSYNLFRSKGSDGILCAVPEDCAVPRFVTEHGWSFGGKVEAGGDGLTGFDERAASTAVRFNGFYLFQATGRAAA